MNITCVETLPHTKRKLKKSSLYFSAQWGQRLICWSFQGGVYLPGLSFPRHVCFPAIADVADMMLIRSGDQGIRFWRQTAGGDPRTQVISSDSACHKTRWLPLLEKLGRRANAVLVFDQRLRRWPNNKNELAECTRAPALSQCWHTAGPVLAQTDIAQPSFAAVQP